MFFIERGNDCIHFPELDSFHREADQKIPLHAVYDGGENNYTVCVVADDQYFPTYSFSPLFPTRENQGQGWSKRPWYTCDSCSSWRINLSNFVLLPHFDRFGFH